MSPQRRAHQAQKIGPECEFADRVMRFKLRHQSQCPSPNVISAEAMVTLRVQRPGGRACLSSRALSSEPCAIVVGLDPSHRQFSRAPDSAHQPAVDNQFVHGSTASRPRHSGTRRTNSRRPPSPTARIRLARPTIEYTLSQAQQFAIIHILIVRRSWPDLSRP